LVPEQMPSIERHANASVSVDRELGGCYDAARTRYAELAAGRLK
jgi:hypothetical protein